MPYELLKPRWIHYRAACYLGGRGLTFGGQEAVPHASKAPGVYSINIDVINGSVVDAVDVDLSAFADGKFDHVFIGPRLDAIEDPIGMFKQLVRKLAVGGHLVIAQQLSRPNATNPMTVELIERLVEDSGRWRRKAFYSREGYLLFIFKRVEGKKGIATVDPAITPAKRVCIARYGALGDMIMITPLIKQLHADGYQVTMNISPYAKPILANNPYVHNIILQEREQIPNPELGPYWDEWKGDYEKYINLSESLEGRFLKVEGRRDFYTPKEWRIKTGEHNYYDATMRLGGYPGITGTRGELFFTAAEERNAQKFFSQHKGKFIIAWAINGSSHHKIYPSMELVCEDWLFAHPDSLIITTGDRSAKQPEFAHPNLIPMCGKWQLREALLAAKYVNCVIGPETMMTNAAGSLGTPTITLLSHSTHEALCKYFPQDYCLAPDQLLAPCHPCFQLHYTKESCPIKRMENSKTHEVVAEAAACALDAISPQRLLTRMEEVYSTHQQRGASGAIG